MNKSFPIYFLFYFLFSFSQNDNEIFIEGVIWIKIQMKALPLANIVFKSLNGKMITGLTANENGEFEVTLNSNEKTVIINC